MVAFNGANAWIGFPGDRTASQANWVDVTGGSRAAESPYYGRRARPTVSAGYQEVPAIGGFNPNTSMLGHVFKLPVRQLRLVHMGTPDREPDIQWFVIATRTSAAGFCRH
jgi:hypothetical protein